MRLFAARAMPVEDARVAIRRVCAPVRHPVAVGMTAGNSRFEGTARDCRIVALENRREPVFHGYRRVDSVTGPACSHHRSAISTIRVPGCARRRVADG